VIVILVGCAAPVPNPAVGENTVTDAMKSTQTNTLSPTNIPEPINTPKPTNTPYPTYTPIPSMILTPTFTPFPPTPTLDPTPTKDIVEFAVSKNHLYKNEKKGVYYELLRIVIKDKEFEDMSSGAANSYWNQANCYVMFEFVVRNNSDSRVSLLLLQTMKVAVGDEQVDGIDYVWDYKYFGDDPQSELMPGISMQGGFWMPLKTKRSDIKKLYIAFDPPFLKSTALEPEIELNFDVTAWDFEPRP
jgi:hypothetical protein